MANENVQVGAHVTGTRGGADYSVTLINGARVQAAPESIPPDTLTTWRIPAGWLTAEPVELGPLPFQAVRALQERLWPHPERMPRVPNRPKDFARWKATWAAAKGMWARGESYESIAGWLYKVHPELGRASRTLADVLRAGDAGLLD